MIALAWFVGLATGCLVGSLWAQRNLRAHMLTLQRMQEQAIASQEKAMQVLGKYEAKLRVVGGERGRTGLR